MHLCKILGCTYIIFSLFLLLMGKTIDSQRSQQFWKSFVKYKKWLYLTTLDTEETNNGIVTYYAVILLFSSSCMFKYHLNHKLIQTTSLEHIYSCTVSHINLLRNPPKIFWAQMVSSKRHRKKAWYFTWLASETGSNSIVNEVCPCFSTRELSNKNMNSFNNTKCVTDFD